MVWSPSLLALDIVSCLVLVLLTSTLPVELLLAANGPTTSHPRRWPPRWPDEIRSDAFPAPRASEHDVFTSRTLHWHELYCGKNRVCRDHVTSSCYLCAPCQCDLNCTIFGDCCPDIVMELENDDFQRPFTGKDNNVLACKNTAVRDPRLKYNRTDIDDNSINIIIRKRQADVENTPVHVSEMTKQNYFMISFCPRTFQGDTSSCESSHAISPVTASDVGSSDVYKNLECARCHDVFDAIPWNIQISCEDRNNVSSAYSPRQVVLTALSQPGCTVVHVPASADAGRKCYFEPEIVNSCNVTGKWTKRDSFLERACHSYLTPKLVFETQYRNVFCFMCNHDDEPETQMLLTSCQKKRTTWNPSMRAILPYLDLTKQEVDGHPLDEIPFKTCNKHGLYDSAEETCRDVTCQAGHQLVKGECQPMFLTARGLGYELYFGLRSAEPIDVSGDHDIITRLPAEIEVYLGQTLLQGKVRLQDFAMSFNTTDQDSRCSQTSDNLGVYARLVSHVMTDQGQLEKDLLRVRYAKFSLDIQAWNMSFQGFPSEVVWHTLQPSRRQSPQTLSSCIIIVSNWHMEQRRDGTIRVGTTTPDPTKSIGDQNPSYIRLSSLLNCSNVQLFPHEYSVTGQDGGLTLTWGVTLPSNRYIMDLELNVTICLPDFLQKLDQNRKTRSPTEETLAIVLLTISLLCLLVCFVVFLLFSVLRSLPGKNNMVLVVSLFSSQISLLIGLLVDDASRLCAVTAIAVHYFTLCVFCSLIVCSFHVYNMFTTMHLSRDLRRDRRFIISYCCFTFCAPVAIVGAVVAVHASHNASWRTFGYGGGSPCLFSSSLSLWLALFLPVVASLMIASVLFCLTSNSLHHNTDIETNRTDEKHVNFYFRASLLISLTWVIGVSGIVTGVSPLRITFIILQSLVGIYVFVSLVLTPRVTRLLSGSCCQSRRHARGRTSLNMKMASSNDCQVKPPCIQATGYKRRDPNVPGSDSRRNPLERYTKRSDWMESVI